MRYAACRRFVTHEERISFGSNLTDPVASCAMRNCVGVRRCTGGNKKKEKKADGVKSDVLHPFRLDKKKGKGKMEKKPIPSGGQGVDESLQGYCNNHCRKLELEFFVSFKKSGATAASLARNPEQCSLVCAMYRSLKLNIFFAEFLSGIVPPPFA